MAEFVVEFDAQDIVCPVVIDEETTVPVEHHLIDGTCHVTSRDQDDESTVRHRQANVCGECICRIVASHGCNPSLQRLTDDGLVLRTNPPDRETLRDLIQRLNEVADSVRIDRLLANGDEPESASGLVNLQELTETERETVERAILEGYYDRPRTVAFDDLADQLGISKSALSKRLGSAEAKIMQDLFRDDESSQ